MVTNLMDALIKASEDNNTVIYNFRVGGTYMKALVKEVVLDETIEITAVTKYKNIPIYDMGTKDTLQVIINNLK